MNLEKLIQKLSNNDDDNKAEKLDYVNAAINVLADADISDEDISAILKAQKFVKKHFLQLAFPLHTLNIYEDLVSGNMVPANEDVYVIDDEKKLVHIGTLSQMIKRGAKKMSSIIGNDGKHYGWIGKTPIFYKLNYPDLAMKVSSVSRKGSYKLPADLERYTQEFLVPSPIRRVGGKTRKGKKRKKSKSRRHRR